MVIPVEMNTCHDQRAPPPAYQASQAHQASQAYQASQATLDLSVTGNLSSVLLTCQYSK